MGGTWILTPSGERYLESLRKARISEFSNRSTIKDFLKSKLSKENLLNYFILDGLRQGLPFFEIEEVLSDFRSGLDSSRFLQISLKRLRRQGWVKEIKSQYSEEEVQEGSEYSELDDFFAEAFPKVPSAFRDFEGHFLGSRKDDY